MDKEIIIDSSRMSGITALRKEIECLKKENYLLKQENRELEIKNVKLQNAYQQLAGATTKLGAVKQALKEIKEDLETSSYCESTECGNDNYGACIECMTKRYLDAINEVLNEK